jgi:YVTN family beta-propeller protein
MVALYAHGRQAEALEVYRVGREALVEEAGLEPGPALRELERAILRQELELPIPVDAPSEPDRARRGGWKLQLLAGLLIAALALAVGLVLRRDPPPALAAIPANSLGVIDPGSNRIVAAIAVGQRPVSVAAGLHGVWVANAADETISRVDPTTRELVKNVRARAHQGTVRLGKHSVWVVGRAGRSPNYQALLSRIDPDVTAVSDRAHYPAISVRYDERLAVTEGFGSVWATAGWRVLRLDDRGRLQLSIDQFSSARALAVGEGAVWVGDIQVPATSSSVVARIDPATNRVAATVPVAPEVAALAAGAGAVWVASDDGTLTKIDPETNVATATVQLGGAPSDVAVGFGSVWVANSGAHNVARIDPETNDVVAKIPTGTAPEGIAVGEGAVWVTAY